MKKIIFASAILLVLGTGTGLTIKSTTRSITEVTITNTEGTTTEIEICTTEEVIKADNSKQEESAGNSEVLQENIKIDENTTESTESVIEVVEDTNPTGNNSVENTSDESQPEIGYERKPGDCDCPFKKWSYVPSYNLDATICVKGIHYMWTGETVLDPDNIECATCGMVIPWGTLPQHLEEYHMGDENCNGCSVPHYISTGYYKQVNE